MCFHVTPSDSYHSVFRQVIVYQTARCHKQVDHDMMIIQDIALSTQFKSNFHERSTN